MAIYSCDILDHILGMHDDLLARQLLQLEGILPIHLRGGHVLIIGTSTILIASIADVVAATLVPPLFDIATSCGKCLVIIHTLLSPNPPSPGPNPCCWNARMVLVSETHLPVRAV